MLTEAYAGMLERGEVPEEAVIRAVEEETGFTVSGISKVCTAYSSPGIFTEQIHYFIAPYHAGQKQAAGGGLPEKREDINVQELSFETALSLVAEPNTRGTKTILHLNHRRT